MKRKPRGNRRPAKTSSTRQTTPHAALHKELHPKSRWEYLDMDYIDTLTNEEKEILSKFIDEYYGAALASVETPEDWENDFHSTDKLRKDCRDRNNARNRDIYTILRTRGWVEGLEGNIQAIESPHVQNVAAQEETLNDAIDLSDDQRAALARRKARSGKRRLRRRRSTPKSPQ